MNSRLLPDEVEGPLYESLVGVLPLLLPDPVQRVLVDLVITVNVECGVAV